MDANKDYRTSFTVDQSPQEVFASILNPRGWWSEDIEGDTDKPGAIFYYHFKDVHHSTLKISDLEPSRRVVWHVLHNYFDFIKDTSEWTGTDIVFEISEKDGKTKLTFTHIGLKPSEECYDVCHDAWSFYIHTSLRNLIVEGKGEPNKKDVLSTNNPVQK
jgi:hypothetical protein